jgi:hypothetical protein
VPERLRSWLRRLAAALGRGLNTVTSHPLIAATLGGVAAGLLLAWITTGGPVGSERAEAIGAPCAPAAKLRGTGTSAESISATSDGSLPAFNGQIIGGDLLRLTRLGERDFYNSLKVPSGTRVRVGIRLDNPGPGRVGEVRVKVELPQNASSVLRLRLTVRFNGVAGVQSLHDAAVIYVASAREACARYVPGSLAEGQKLSDGTYWRNPLAGEDHIVSPVGLNRGDVREMHYPEADYLYFDVVVV